MKTKSMLYILMIFLMGNYPLISQGVAISEDEEDTPHSSSILHLISTDKGFLIPRMTENQRDNISEPAKGLLIYNTDDDEFQYNAGDEDSPSWQGIGGSVSSLWSEGSGNNIYRDLGSVGIGLDNPNEKLTIDGAVSIAEINTVPTATSDFGKIYITTDDNLWYKNSGGDVALISYEYAVYEDRKSAGTDGGTYSTSDDWLKRDLNTVVASSGNSISLNTSTSVITLDEGTYRIVASAPAYRVRHHKTRFRKTSGTGSTDLYGTTEYSSTSDYPQTRSMIDGIISVSSDDTTFELQHKCSNSNTGDGLGVAADLGEQEVYSRVFIQKIR